MITAKTVGLIFSLFDIASAQVVPFGIPQYILLGLTTVLLCIFADSKSYRFGGSTWWLPLFNGDCPHFSCLALFIKLIYNLYSPTVPKYHFIKGILLYSRDFLMGLSDQCILFVNSFKWAIWHVLINDMIYFAGNLICLLLLPRIPWPMLLQYPVIAQVEVVQSSSQHMTRSLWSRAWVVKK